jgi:hypothetical protein
MRPVCRPAASAALAVLLLVPASGCSSGGYVRGGQDRPRPTRTDPPPAYRWTHDDPYEHGFRSREAPPPPRAAAGAEDRVEGEILSPSDPPVVTGLEEDPPAVDLAAPPSTRLVGVRSVAIAPPPPAFAISVGLATSHVHGAGCGHFYWDGSWWSEPCPPAYVYLSRRSYPGDCGRAGYVGYYGPGWSRPPPVVFRTPCPPARPVVAPRGSVRTSIGFSSGASIRARGR